jgi:cysteinyl-tRNA synthetase
MMMRLYNSLTHKIEDFTPINPPSVTLYTCGPTVYSYYHIGNLRNAVFNDTLRRTLGASGYKVKHVMNITDVGHLTSDADEGDDKLEKGAKAEGKTVWEVADFYAEAFKKDVADLNILSPNGYKGPKDSYARATDFINEQINIVRVLLEKGFAYETKRAIYFDVAKLDDYGELTGQKLSEKEVAARPDVITDSDKHHSQDFALWFFTVGHFEGHNMHWPSPWGDGFPGWHLECSAIIHTTLGDPIDIHTGAVDLIGTHHTNEMAQTEAAFGHKLANYWVHNEYVLVEGKKMSKSLDNIYTLTDIKQRGYDLLALRLLFLQAHYRSQLNFTWESLEAAQSFLKNLQAWADSVKQTGVPAIDDADSNRLISEIKTAMESDLNSARALVQINEFIDKVAPTFDLLHQIDDYLGLNLANRPDVSDTQKDIISKREDARKSNDWTRSDELREQLQKQGIEINDTSNGPIWSRN